MFDEKAERALRVRSLAFTSLAHFLNDSFLITMSVLIDYYLSMNVSAVFLGAMAAMVSLLSGLLSPLVSSYADRSGSHNTLMLIGFALIGTSSALFAASFIVGGLLRLTTIGLGAALLGSGLAFYHPLGGAILQNTFRDNPGRALGFNGSLGSVGRALFPTVMVVLIHYLGGSMALAIIAVYVYVLALIIYVGLRPVRMPAVGGSAAQAMRRLSAFYYILVPLTAVVFVRAMFMSGVMTYAFTYIDSLVHSRIVTGVAVTTAYATAIGGQPLFGWLTGKYGGRSIVFLTTAVSTAFYILFLLARGAVALTTLLGIYSLFALSGFPVLLGYVNQVVSPEVRALANSLVWGIGNTVGGAVGVLIGGLVVGYRTVTLWKPMSGLDAAMWLFAIFALASTAMLPIIPKGQQARQP